MLMTFKCKRCHCVFDCDFGSIAMPESSAEPYFERGVICPICGEVTIDDVHLTEPGECQLATETLDIDDDFWDFADSQCYGCDRYLPVNDLNLCDECDNKLDRDFIRKRDWDYSKSVFGLDPSKREELRKQVVARHGEKLELITYSRGKKRSARKHRKRRKKTL
ncbi:MAG: hypothetical protein FJ135_14285 [Deltaproteobacteria bacterium]|nr:hypothetical protein [Deltaproteobacteria bacterium]